MCPAGRCYLDYRQAAEKIEEKTREAVGGKTVEEDENVESEEPGAWYATLTLRDCWEFDPLIIDEAVAVEEGEEEEGEEGTAEKGGEEARARAAGGGAGGDSDGRAHSEELTLASGGGAAARTAA